MILDATRGIEPHGNTRPPGSWHWLRWKGSNLRPSGYEPDKLPLLYTAICNVPDFIHLSTHSMASVRNLTNAHDRNRTCDYLTLSHTKYARHVLIKLVGEMRIELITSRLSVVCASQLRHSPILVTLVGYDPTMQP